MIINADDFGLTDGLSEGIVEAHAGGVVTSTSLMVLAPAAERAARLARDQPRLSVGLHVVDERLDQPAREFERQLERFRELIGRDPTHVDSHHHVHMRRLDTFRELVAPLGVPLRGAGQVCYIGGFWGQSEDRATRSERVSVGHLIELVRAHAGDGLTELGCHPGRVTAELTSSYRDERATELVTLTEPGLADALARLGMQLVSYHAWVGLSTG